ncbi:MAG TPA: ABC transporter substrate-binding protein, partial [Rhodopila sp.]|nr:ABC transporter substrate-binding protein [Rhodopila sp.]
MIPADSPPSLDGHRETTYATVHATAPFYSVLIRINLEDPSSPSDYVCDLCTAMPTPTDDDKTYTFRIRDGVKWHDGSPLTAYDVAASWQAIVHPPPPFPVLGKAISSWLTGSRRLTRQRSYSTCGQSLRRHPIPHQLRCRTGCRMNTDLGDNFFTRMPSSRGWPGSDRNGRRHQIGTGAAI